MTNAEKYVTGAYCVVFALLLLYVLLIAAKLGFTADQRLLEVSAATNVIEQRIRDAVPSARSIYIEPDVYRPGLDPAPPTDVFVLKSAD